MPDPLSAAERYRSDAAKFLELAKDASSYFIRDYYNGLAKRYLKHAEDQEEMARTPEGSAVTEIILDSPAFKPLQNLRPRKRQSRTDPHRRHPCSPLRSRPMLPSEVSAAVRPAARGDHARPRHRRRHARINPTCADLDRMEDQFVAAGLTDQDIVLGINTSRRAEIVENELH